jgi:hypothetical protein
MNCGSGFGPLIPLAVALEWAHHRVVRSGLEGAMASTDHFRLAQMCRATAHGSVDILMTSGELYRSLGGYPGSSHGMPFCCDAMQDEMRPGDILLVERRDGVG